MLIFPTMRTRSGDNQVRAGVLIDIPAQEDATPYFTLNSNHSGYVSELLTVIITPRPLEGFVIGRKPLLIPPAQLAKWEREWGVPVEQFEMEGGAGTTWTLKEQLASQAAGRALTQEEPSPQTIYRVAVKPGAPLLIQVQLRARRSHNSKTERR